jgi:hypothetical protein
MTAHRNRRRLNGLLGVFLVGVAVGAGVLFGGNLLGRPALFSQVVLVGMAGICDLIAATDRNPPGHWAWYQWSGLGNILLGISLPLGFVGSSDALFFLLVTSVGGLSLAAIGVDMLAFHGVYTHGDRLDADLI